MAVAERYYGFFANPEENDSYFKEIHECEKTLPIQEGGCLFWVGQEFLDKHMAVLNDQSNAGRWVFVEIAGTRDVIQTDPLTGSVFRVAILSEELTIEECQNHCPRLATFESSFLANVMPFEMFCTLFSVRRLN